MLKTTPKNWWLSKTNWFGILTFLISVVGFIAGTDFIKQYPEVVSIIGAVVGILTVILRYLTTGPVSPPTSGGTNNGNKY